MGLWLQSLEKQLFLAECSDRPYPKGVICLKCGQHGQQNICGYSTRIVRNLQQKHQTKIDFHDHSNGDLPKFKLFNLPFFLTIREEKKERKIHIKNAKIYYNLMPMTNE